MASSSSLHRMPTQIRRPTIQLDPLPHSDGSCLFSFGPQNSPSSQSSLASVTGPSEIRIRDELTDRAKLECNVLPLQGVQGIVATSFGQGALGAALAQVVLTKRYPRSLIALDIQTANEAEAARPLGLFADRAVLQGQRRRRQSIRPRRPHPDAPLGATERAAHINAAMMAVIRGGVDCVATICAVAMAVVPARVVKHTRQAKGGEASLQGADDEDETAAGVDVLVVDPDPTEEEFASSTHVFAFACSGHVVDCSELEEGKSDQVDGDGHRDRDGNEDEVMESAATSHSSAQAKLVLVESQGTTDTKLVSVRSSPYDGLAVTTLADYLLFSRSCLTQYFDAIAQARGAALSVVYRSMRQAVEDSLVA